MKKVLHLPQYVIEILDELKKNFYSAYVVGGSVRDLYLGKEPYDYDITTDALPHEILSVFEKNYLCLTCGIKHGTITVIANGNSVEITTFRIDGKYSDSRHPEKVDFTKKLTDDLKRRDFTVNALVYNTDSGLADFFGGIDDINLKIIRCIGDPEKRFSEDALRILRAIRFAVTLGFEIENATEKAILSQRKLLKNISCERILVELKKMFSGKYSEILSCVLEKYVSVFDVIFGVKLEYKEYVKICRDIAKISDTNLRFYYYVIALCRFDIEKVCGVTRRLKMSNDDKNTLKSLLYAINSEKEALSYIDAKQIVSRYGIDICFYAAGILKDVHDVDFFRYLLRIQKEKPCLNLDQLEIDGNDVMKYTCSVGKEIGLILKNILDLVITEKLENKRKVLVDFLLKTRGL